MAIVVFDDFNKPDNPTSLGTASTGQIWTQTLGNWSIQSNNAVLSWAPLADSGFAFIESGLVNGITRLVLENANSLPNFANGAGLVFRRVDANNFWQLVFYKFGVNHVLTLSRFVAGVGPTVMLTVNPVVVNDGDEIAVAYCGHDYDVLLNNVSVGTFNDEASHTNPTYGTQSGLVTSAGAWFAAYDTLFGDFTVETNDACASVSPSATPSASPSASASASPAPCTPPEGSVISAVNARGRLFVTLANQDNSQIAYAWHEGGERMPISSMTNWKGSRRALTLQELGLAFETDNADEDNPMIVSVHRNLRKNYARDARVNAGSNRIDSLDAQFDADNIGDMVAVFGENIGGPGVHFILGRIAALASPSASPSPSASLSASPSATGSASPSLSPSASPSSSRSGSPSPSHSPSASPSTSPSRSPSASPSVTPSASPSASPSSSGSASPSASPSSSTSASPSAS